MHSPKTLKGLERTRLLNELHEKYGHVPGIKQRLVYLRKKYSWMLIIEGTKFFKRLLDILLSSFLLILLSPIMLLIAALIKLTDGGPIFYVTVGSACGARNSGSPNFDPCPSSREIENQTSSL